VDRRAHIPRTHATAADEADARRDVPALQDVSFKTSDGLTLKGWFAPGPKRATIVFVHGGAGNRTQLFPDARVLARHGYGILTYDSRACGESEGDLVSWGEYEQRDVFAALDFLSTRPEVDPHRVGVVGFSIGGSTVALAAARDPRAHAVVLYATWSSLEGEMKRNAGRFGPLSWGPALYGFRREGIEPDAVRPIDHVGEIAPRPLLMIAGTEDTDTPVDVMRQVFAAAQEPKELWVEPGASHGGYVQAQPAEYEARVVAFFDSNL
jgi:uncharacterized protein